jgi:hypothetical protein
VDFRDTSIMTQVAFKGAVDLGKDVDLDSPDGQAWFVRVFTFLTDALVEGVKTQTGPEAQAAEVIKGHFPGTQTVQQNPTSYEQPTNGGGWQVTIQGEVDGPVPPWLYTQAEEKRVAAVWDNRKDARQNPDKNRPWFKSVNPSGRDAIPFWPPKAR